MRDSTTETKIVGDVAALLTLKANWFDTPTVKQWETMITNDVRFSVTNVETLSSSYITGIVGDDSAQLN